MLAPSLFPTAAIFILTALSAGGALAALLYPRVAKPRPFQSRFESIAAAGSALAPLNGGTDDTRRKRSLEETLQEMDKEQRARSKQKGAKPTLTRRMRQAQLNWSRKTYYTVCIFAMLGSCVAAVAAGAPIFAAAGFGVAGGLLLPHFYVNLRRNRRFNRFSAEFPSAVDVIVRGIKSGLPLADCIRIVATEAQEPVRGEFRTVVEDQTIGMPMDKAIARLAERVPLTETGFFAIVIGIQLRSGGSLSEALGNLSKVLRERKKMQAKIKAMSAEAKASGGIIGALPVVVASLVYLTSPDYIALLATETIGNVVLAACALWMSIGVFVMHKMINFDF